MINNNNKRAEDVCLLSELQNHSRRAVLEEIFNDRYPNALSRIITECELQSLKHQYHLVISLVDYNIYSRHLTLLIEILKNYGFVITLENQRDYNVVASPVIKIQWGHHRREQ